MRKILAFLVALVLLGVLEMTGLNARYYTNGNYLCILYCLSSANSMQFPRTYHNGNIVIASEYVSVSVGYNGEEKLSIMSPKKESRLKLLSCPSSILSDAKFLL